MIMVNGKYTDTKKTTKVVMEQSRMSKSKCKYTHIHFEKTCKS